jgi:hypothetical protein
MVTGRNFSMSGIISGHHNQPTYEMSLKSENVELVRIVAAINFSRSPFTKWPPQYRTNSTLFDFNVLN